MTNPQTTDMKFTGLLFWTQENTLSEKFYKKLGFEVLKSAEDHSVVRLGDLEVVLVNMRDEAPFTGDSMTTARGKGLYVYIEVEDVDREYTRQVQLGLAPATEPKDWEWGNREFVLKDPDGYKLVFFSKK